MPKSFAFLKRLVLLMAASLLAGLALIFRPPSATQAEVSLPPIAVGVAPGAVAVNSVTNKIYVTNSGSNNVAVIDGTTNVTATVATGITPVDVAVNPVTDKVYVLNYGSHDVTVIDGATNATTTVPVPASPDLIAVNSVTNKIYLVGYWGHVTVMDGATNATTVINTAMAWPNAMAVNSVTNKVYIVTSGTLGSGCIVVVLDGVSNNFTLVTAGDKPLAVAVNQVTNKIYVANSRSNDVTVIDGETNTTTTIPVGSYPYAVAVNPVTNKIYVANWGDNSVTVIDGATSATVTVAVGERPGAVAVNPVKNEIYVANHGFDHPSTVTAIDGATNGTTTFAAGSFPTAVAVNPETNKVYVANWGSNDVTVIDSHPLASSTKTVNVPIAVPGSPLTYTITLSNTGTENLTGVALTDTLPADLAYVGGSLAATSGVYTYTDGVVRWDGAVNLLDSVTITFKTTVKETAPWGDLVNMAFISSSESAISRTATTTIIDPLEFSSKSVEWPVPSADSPLTYTILLRNEGLSDIADATLTDTLPAGLAYIPGTLAAPSGDYGYADGTIHWTGAVQIKQSVPITFQAQLTEPPFPGELINTAFIGHDGKILARTASAHLGLWYVDTQGNDDNSCYSPTSPCATIKAAIGKATSGDIIYVATGTYTRNVADNEAARIDKNIVLSGGWDAAFVSQNGMSTLYNPYGSGRGITVNDGIVAQLERFIVRNGSSQGGGGVENRGTLTVRDCTFSGNAANCPSGYNCSLLGGGGGIENIGTLTVTNSFFVNNSADHGGGIYNTGTLTVTNTTFSGNTAGTTSHGGLGGAISNHGTLTIISSTFYGNTAVADWNGSEGGGIRNIGTLTISDSTFVGNAAGNSYNRSMGGGIFNSGILTVTNNTFADNRASATCGGMGGGVYNVGQGTIINSTFSSNAADGGEDENANFGGGLYNGGQGTIINSTFTRNRASPSTFTGVGGGGGVFNASNSLTLRNTIMASSLGGGGDCRNRSLLVGAYNLVETTGTDACGLSNGVDGNIVGQDPLLGSLQDNGGPTQTHALLSGSLAVNAGDNAACPSTDQRGSPRFGQCDIGAFERIALVDSTKAVNLARVSHGSTLSYTIYLPNDVMDIAPVTVTDALPPFLSYVDNSLFAATGSYGYLNGVISWTGSINKGETVTLTFAASVDPVAPTGLITNVAAIDVAGTTFTRTASTNVVYVTYVPLVTQRTCMAGICGRVTLNGSPAAGVSLALRFYNGSTWSTRATRTTGSDGGYAFTNMPALGPGQEYYVLYQNSGGTRGHLWIWATKLLTTYAAGSIADMGVFDIADITLVAPGSGATVSLPYNFQWTRRPATPSDSYEFDLYYWSSSPYFYTPLLGYVDSYDLSCLPAGFSFGPSYFWEVWVYSPDGGYGISYWSHRVQFDYGSTCPEAAVQSAGTPLQQRPDDVPDVEGRPRP